MRVIQTTYRRGHAVERVLIDTDDEDLARIVAFVHGTAARKQDAGQPGHPRTADCPDQSVLRAVAGRAVRGIIPVSPAVSSAGPYLAWKSAANRQNHAACQRAAKGGNRPVFPIGLRNCMFGLRAGAVHAACDPVGQPKRHGVGGAPHESVGTGKNRVFGRELFAPLARLLVWQLALIFLFQLLRLLWGHSPKVLQLRRLTIFVINPDINAVIVMTPLVIAFEHPEAFGSPRAGPLKVLREIGVTLSCRTPSHPNLQCAVRDLIGTSLGSPLPQQVAILIQRCLDSIPIIAVRGIGASKATKGVAGDLDPARKVLPDNSRVHARTDRGGLPRLPLAIGQARSE